jgi:hypothetical protein
MAYRFVYKVNMQTLIQPSSHRLFATQPPEAECLRPDDDTLMQRFARLSAKQREQFARRNNCYSWAAGDAVTLENDNPYGYPPQPGDGTGVPFAAFNFHGQRIKLLTLTQLLRLDGARPLYKSGPLSHERQIAMVMYNDHKHPGQTDYHFYAQGSNGLWSHKMGDEDPSHYDDEGRLITDPRRMALDGQLVRPLFFAIPKTGLRLALASAATARLWELSSLDRKVRKGIVQPAVVAEMQQKLAAPFIEKAGKTASRYQGRLAKVVRI